MKARPYYPDSRLLPLSDKIRNFPPPKEPTAAELQADFARDGEKISSGKKNAKRKS